MEITCVRHLVFQATCAACQHAKADADAEARAEAVRKLPAPDITDDITKNRNKGNKFSAAAHRKSARRRASAYIRLYEYFVQIGEKGCTCDEAGAALGLNGRSSSGRCSELKRDKKLFGTGRSGRSESGDPDGGEILVADIYWLAFEKAGD